MDEVIGQRPSIRPPVLLSTLPEDTPGPGSAVGDQNVAESDTDEGDSQPPTTARKRKRNRGDELLNLIREDMQQQRGRQRKNAERLVLDSHSVQHREQPLND